MNRRNVWLSGGLIAAVVGLAVLAGCGGSGGGGAQPAGGTGITGTVVDVTSQIGIAGIVVTAGKQSATSTLPDGSFTISGMAPGTYDLVVQPKGSYVPVPGPAPQVKVQAGEATNVGNVWIIDSGNLPTGP
jgi:hypothetical protein